jgi:hypothetical protein
VSPEPRLAYGTLDKPRPDATPGPGGPERPAITEQAAMAVAGLKARGPVGRGQRDAAGAGPRIRAVAAHAPQMTRSRRCHPRHPSRAAD